MLDFLNELKVSMDVSQGITDNKPLVMVFTRFFAFSKLEHTLTVRI